MVTESDEPMDPRLSDALRTLRDTPPSVDLWPEIAPQLARRLPPGSLLLRWPTAIAAGLLIAVGSVAGTALLLGRGAPVVVTTAPTRTNGSGVIAAANTPADAALQRAIQDLEIVLGRAAEALAPETRTSIQESLATLDQAINEAAAQQRALPSDPRLARYLTSVLQKKFEVLQIVTQRAIVRT